MIFMLINAVLAHVIRHQSTKQFRAVFELEAQFRWCLTGTPIQNKLEDLASLIKFLRIPLLERLSEFRRHIMHPIEIGSNSCLRNLRLLLDSVCLRRSKELLNLAESAEKIKWIDLSPHEEQKYLCIGEQSRIAIEDAVSGKNTAMAYSTVLKALLQLRTLCNNGTYTRTGGIDATQGIVEKSRETLERLWQEDQASCVNCSRTVSSLNLSGDHGSGYLTACPHLICAVCMPLYRIEAENEQEPRVQCLSCIEDVLQQFSGLEPEYIANSPDFGLEQENSVFPSMVDEHSSKMSALVAELQQNMNGSKR